ncbi:alpha/beta hydrolase [Proteiniclasticum sp. SCR006]|uniref:Alpha/beta hydrolase n=1 Tax=Proteiniclasticum aestuarii TaxID=2817862 RepID=A0A939H9K3_9CLOT|nr:alpha/beta hydrolase [Proteiniclasticum aestuarii]MBO1263585.1 alpha/beta hydrolase [Proteiniclasticum aestuarii]
MKPLKRITLRALSSIDMNIKKNYKLFRKVQKIITPPPRVPYRAFDHKVMTGDREIPIRLFIPKENRKDKVMIFFHGGGWVTGDIDTYTPVCATLAEATGHTIVSVDYALAPENPYPIGLQDCYTAAKEIFQNIGLLGATPEDITLIGDSAGGNLAAVVSLMARDKGEFMPRRQILIYPATYHDHSIHSPFRSVQENGEDFILTAERIEDYMDLYVPVKAARKTPYVAPLIADDLSAQPKTLIITSEYDPLRDEGEAYGKRLRSFGNEVRIFQMKEALHGYMNNPLSSDIVEHTIEIINLFLSE